MHDIIESMVLPIKEEAFMILACQNISKSFGERTLIKNGSFHIEANEKTALVGINGAGKSTLLKIIMNELPADSGNIVISKDASLGYLAQHQELNVQNSIYEEVKSAKQNLIDLEVQIRALELEIQSLEGNTLETKLNLYHRLTSSFEQQNGYAYKSELTGVLKGLGFSEADFQKTVNTLSGGEKTRVSLGKLLLTKPDFLLLDEPTNHLDLHSITWLETYLSNYNGAVLIVSHDRYFLNRVVTKVVEIEQGDVYTYLGNYSTFSEKKKQLRDARIKEYMNQQQEIKHQEEVIQKLRSFNREKSIKRAESREKLLDKIERIEKPLEQTASLHFSLEPARVSGNDVLKVENLQKSFTSKCLFQNASFEVKRGDHIAIIGANGTGKTTLLKILNQTLPADNGTFTLGANVSIGYYDQEHMVLDSKKTIFDEISDAYPALTGTQIRNTLAAFLFTGDEVFQPIETLSGGERGRVSLAKLMLSESNFLILDEPTNHLDIASKEILENALNDYTGTVLYVSHDRYFINQTATRILELVNETFVNYIGNYDYYMEKQELHRELYAAENASSEDTSVLPAAKMDWQSQKEEQAALRKRGNDLKKLEEEIETLEARDGEIDHLLTQEEIYSVSSEALKLTTEKAEITAKLELLYKKWETLAE